MGAPHSITDRTPHLCLLAAGVYVERDEKILLLQRAAGAMVGFWSMPGGVVEAGERPEDAAIREVKEESGITLSGGLRMVGITTLRAYGYPCYRVVYAGSAALGPVTISSEHCAYQWMRPAEYRSDHLSDEAIAQWGAHDPANAAIVTAVRETF
ncbi:MAG: NUDIX hydrolase, partial [Gammaproteobacteria bacterium]|nr:NUDIX hydrolase [Gammaproteobacteria bacterium]